MVATDWAGPASMVPGSTTPEATAPESAEPESTEPESSPASTPAASTEPPSIVVPRFPDEHPMTSITRHNVRMPPHIMARSIRPPGLPFGLSAETRKSPQNTRSEAFKAKIAFWILLSPEVQEVAATKCET